MSSEESRKKKIRRDLYYEGSEEIYHDLFSGDVFTHIYTHVYTHVWLIILLLTCQIYVKAIWTTDVRGCSESLPWNVKEYTEVYEWVMEEESVRGGEGKREGVDKHFATFARKFRPSPDVFWERKACPPFGLYAVLLAISYKLCVQYCDKRKKNESFSISLRPFSFLKRMHVQCETGARIHINICRDKSPVFNPVP